MTLFPRLLAPAAVLGAVLLLGERPSNPPDEASCSISAVSDDLAGRPIPCPALLPGEGVTSLPAVPLPHAAAARLQAAAPSPEARTLSPPRAA